VIFKIVPRSDSAAGTDSIDAVARHHLRSVIVLSALGFVLVLIAILSIASGALEVSPGQVVSIFGDLAGLQFSPFAERQAAVVLAIRVPRVLLDILVGAGLAVSGAALQGLFRNPLADPGLIGVSSGAALAAVFVIVLGATVPPSVTELLGMFMLPLAAFGGGFAATVVVYRFSAGARGVSVATMLLAGIAINAFAGSLTGLLIFTATDAQLRSITFWSMGSTGGATWRSIGSVAILIILPVFLILRTSRALNVLLLGESEAGHLGFPIERLKRRIVACAAMSVGAAVSVSGIIGFVGLVCPHLLRLAFGPDHRLLLPGSALLGAILLMTADLFARTIVTPAELPIGIVTALLGAPFFLYLLIRQRQVQL